MCRTLFLSLVLPAAIVCFSAECSYSQTKKKSSSQKKQSQKSSSKKNNSKKRTRNRRSSRRSRRNKNAQFHPMVLAVFRLPGNLPPDEKQLQEMQKLLKEYGPKMQVLVPYLQAGQKFDLERERAKNATYAQKLATARLRRLQNLRTGNRTQILKKQIAEAKKEAKKLEGEVKRAMAFLLTEDQKVTLREMRKKSREQKKKKKT